MTPFETLSLTFTGFGIVVGVVVAIIYGMQLSEMRQATLAAKRSTDIAAQTLAVTQRGYVRISNFALAIGTDRTMILYRLSVDGPTYIDIVGGTIGISIDEPPLSAEERAAGRYTAQIKSQRVVPRDQGAQQAQVAALPKEHQELLQKGGPVKVFYSGDIWYRDAFNGTPTHHRIFGYSVFGDKTEPLDNLLLARNNETDEEPPNK